ncbi:hypothetical protein A2875_04870 [Candidatus Gottesmanbacteria bacterium RIFCSPHIGHO2_01_FULL_46_14]|uniref:Uncharacterized protein n=3 Tax=Candidatus Gottesmaniibacteriota TaxID=1752720 RepID=A0A1F5ZPD5_9BACT|nr:MAG: hypothetical protein UY08_C0010G0010 [Candidatus Gottesmanbacteria bacterium GW2011_GWA1_47_8]OGG14194.1 MAG: hypothetical protein A2875_04870 [Candidatus Gottesmanbacteria bacterium RIFCSPHIGHO2_01_FULL_46_14]OGG29439.1 MAG: hypothetical protein A2971_02620 [Candidatus Gottesmanbacteria bacterium RIFCSPLOWO2_01_FULL_46_21]
MLPFTTKVYADAKQIIGAVNPGILPYGDVDAAGKGFVLFFSNILRLVFLGAGIYALLNIVVAGFGFMSAGGDTKAIGAAWARIWQSLLGLVIIVGSFALAALFGYLIFGDAGFILNPKIYGPEIPCGRPHC